MSRWYSDAAKEVGSEEEKAADKADDPAKAELEAKNKEILNLKVSYSYADSGTSSYQRSWTCCYSRSAYDISPTAVIIDH